VEISTDIWIFVGLIGVGAVMQSTSGFALGLVAITGMSILDLRSIPFTTAVVGLISLVNCMTSLSRTHRLNDWRLIRWVTLSLLPGLVAGLVLLSWLEARDAALLKRLLGGVVVAAALSMLARPASGRRSSAPVLVLAGSLGGLVSGLFSAGGTALGFMMYRQPMPVAQIRATLLGFLVIATVCRSVIIGLDGQLTREVLLTTAIAFPLVITISLVVTRVAGGLPDLLVRRMAAGLLAVAGTLLLVG